MGKGNYSPWWPLGGNLLLLLFAASSLGSLAVHFVAWEPFSIAVSKAQRLWQGRGCEIHRLVGGRWAAEQQAWVAAYTVSACLQAGSRVLAGCRCFSLLAGAVARAKSWSAGEPGTGGAPELLLWCMVILLSGAGWSCMVECGAPWCWCWGPAPVTRTCSSRRPRPKQHQGSRKLETILGVRLFPKLPKTIFNGKTLRAPCVLPAPPWKQHRLVPIQKLVFKERWNKTRKTPMCPNIYPPHGPETVSEQIWNLMRFWEPANQWLLQWCWKVCSAPHSSGQICFARN